MCGGDIKILLNVNFSLNVHEFDVQNQCYKHINITLIKIT
jgi:hypothetical protein